MTERKLKEREEHSGSLQRISMTPKLSFSFRRKWKDAFSDVSIVISRSIETIPPLNQNRFQQQNRLQRFPPSNCFHSGILDADLSEYRFPFWRLNLIIILMELIHCKAWTGNLSLCSSIYSCSGVWK